MEQIEGGSFIWWIQRDGIDINKLRVNGRLMTDAEIWAMYPIPPPFSMWGTPARIV